MSVTSLARDRLTPAGAGLRAAKTDGAGITRRRCGKGFAYLSPYGETLGGEARARCVALAVPPAWQGVWIAPHTKDHIQAYGEDAAGRRQYIYHDDYRAAAETAKYADLPLFADRLPRLRRRVSRLLGTDERADRLALAAAVRLIDRAGLRVGYGGTPKQTGARGATTLRASDIAFEDGRSFSLDFTAKGGTSRALVVTDPLLLEALERLLEQGTEGPLFQTASGKVTAEAVNDFVAEAMDAPFTARDFRTWGGSVAAASALSADQSGTIGAISEAAAAWLGNTPAIAKASYIHPAILDRARAGEDAPAPSGPRRLRVDERRAYAAIS